MIPTSRPQPDSRPHFDRADPIDASATADVALPSSEATDPTSPPIAPDGVGGVDATGTLDQLLAEWRAAERAVLGSPVDSLERQDRMHASAQARRRYQARFDEVNGL